MKSRLVLLMLLCAPLPRIPVLHAETAAPSPEYRLRDLDFSSARASLAGANWICVRSVKAGDAELELLIRIESRDTWVVEKIVPQEESLWAEDLILNFLEIRAVGSDRLELAGLLADGKFYAAAFRLQEPDRMILDGELQESGLPSSLAARAGALKSTLVEKEKALFEGEKEKLLEAVRSLTLENGQLTERLSEQPAEPVAAASAERAPTRWSSLESMRPLLGRTLLQGFDAGVPHSGAWKIGRDTAEQFDTEQYFAKLVFPVVQTKKPTLFSFDAKAEGAGWVGMGIHIYVREAALKRGYGLGRSLLVWLTRDPEAYGSSDTYLQLYSSTDAVTMKRALDAVIPENIDRFNRIEVLYDPSTEYIVVAVNGVEKIRYKTWFSISSGAEIALRTLKAKTTFRNLRVATTD